MPAQRLNFSANGSDALVPGEVGVADVTAAGIDPNGVCGNTSPLLTADTLDGGRLGAEPALLGLPA